MQPFLSLSYALISISVCVEILLLEETHRTADPVFVFVEVNPNHFAPAQPAQVGDQSWSFVFRWPDKQHPDFALDEPIGRLNNRLVRYFALNQVIVTLVWGNGIEVGTTNVKPYSTARKREQRLQT
jgi:hypothetical protein